MVAPLAIPLTDIRPEPLTWLWPRYIPRGKLTLLDGDPQLGKSLLTLDLAARLSTGRPLPDGSGGGLVGRTLLLAAEDKAADTVYPRLAAAGADLAQVRLFVHADGRPPRLPRNVPALERTIGEWDVALVVIDPLIAFLSPSVWVGSDQLVRGALGRLAGVAERTGAGMIMIRHLNKTVSQKALYRGGGSIGIIGSARAALLATGDPAPGGPRVLAATKANLGPLPPALGYRVIGTDAGAGVVEWMGPVGLTADEALRPARVEEPESVALGLIPATEWLMEFLRGGPRSALDVYQAAAAEGISERTLIRAKEPAAVQSKLMTDKETGRRRWMWRLYRPPKFLPPLPPLPFEEEDEDGW
jgi:hypothetical protein